MPSSSRYTKGRTTWQVADGEPATRARAFVPDSFRARGVSARRPHWPPISPAQTWKGRPREWRAASLIRPGRPLQNPDPCHPHLSTARHVGMPSWSGLRPRPSTPSLPSRGAARMPRHSCQPGRPTGRCPPPPCNRDLTTARVLITVTEHANAGFAQLNHSHACSSANGGGNSQRSRRAIGRPFPAGHDPCPRRQNRYERHRGQRAAFESRS